MKKTMLALVSLGAAFAFGAVQNITITEANAHAYSASNRLACDSGSKISVTYSYRLNGETMKSALLDFIDVTPPADGDPEPWVSISLDGAGLTNDVDFTEQPYLWLGAPVDGTACRRMDGVYEPYGDVYRFGYAGGANGEMRGICVTNLVDNPITGAPRSVLVRGAGVTSFVANNCSYTGGIVVEGPAYAAVGAGNGFGSGSTATPKDFVTLRNVDGKEAQINFKNPGLSYPVGFRVEGTNKFHSCGASKIVCTVFNGPISGYGKIRLTDQGGVRFANTNNTFTGSLEVASNHGQYDIEIGFGNGGVASWAGSEIIQKGTTNNIIVVNCTNEFTLGATLSSAGGRLVKKGSGNLILGKAFPRKPIAGREDIPVIQIFDGKVTRTAQEPSAASGLIEFHSGNCTLDLNNVPAESLWLPFGYGSIVNPADGEVTLSGAPIEGASFFGTVEGKTTLNMTSSNPLLVSDRTTFVGALEIASGTLTAVDGFRVPSLDVADGAQVEMLSRDGTDSVGLKMELWYAPGASWGGATHADCLVKAVAHADANWNSPDFVGDMSKFGETFYSGANNDAGGTTDGAFAKTLGSSKNHFFARFTGFIDVDEDGTYGFRGAADDGVRILIDGEPVVSGATGNANWLTSGNVELTAGRHPFQVDFLEESGWEVLWVQMKKGNGGWEYIPLAKLSSWSGLHSDFGAVTGKGAVALKAAGVAWPGMDLGGFEGRLIANEFTAGPDAGYVAPVNSAIHFMDAYDIAGTNWWYSGPAKAITHNGKSAWDMGGVASTDAYANRLKPLDLSKPFTASFDFFIHEPWSGNYAGDGFFIGLHDKANGGYGGTFSYDTSKIRINNYAAYGLQAYMMPGSSYFSWIKNNNYIGSVTTNSTYQMNNAKNPAKPYHTTFTWDCEKLVFMFEQDGKAPFAMTNTLAAADIAEKFPGGTAYFGLWVRNGGWYTAMTFADFMIADGEDGGRETVTFNGVLGITNGVTRVTSSAGADAEIASELLVTGDGALNTEVPAGLTGGKWTFDLREPTAKLALTGEFTLPSDPIVVDLIGEPEARSRVLADLTGIEDNAATFALASDLPGSYNLVYDNGLLKVSAGRGTVIIFR